MSTPTQTQALVDELTAVITGAFSREASARGNHLYAELGAQWLRDYHPAGHHGALPVTYRCYVRDLGRLQAEGGAIWPAVRSARTAYEAWHARGRAEYLGA